MRAGAAMNSAAACSVHTRAHVRCIPLLLHMRMPVAQRCLHHFEMSVSPEFYQIGLAIVSTVSVAVNGGRVRVSALLL
jgi:hypothetical protein